MHLLDEAEGTLKGDPRTGDPQRGTELLVCTSSYPRVALSVDRVGKGSQQAAQRRPPLGQLEAMEVGTPHASLPPFPRHPTTTTTTTPARPVKTRARVIHTSPSQRPPLCNGSLRILLPRFVSSLDPVRCVCTHWAVSPTSPSLSSPHHPAPRHHSPCPPPSFLPNASSHPAPSSFLPALPLALRLPMHCDAMHFRPPRFTRPVPPRRLDRP